MLELQYYVDKPGRDLTIPNPDSVVWIDIEVGCFQDPQDVRDQGTLNTQSGMRTGIYGNSTSILPIFSDNELADYGLPLWYADYRAPDFSTFIPFLGWDKPALWQYWEHGYLEVNCDLSITPDGRIFADISNYTTLTQQKAEFFKHTLDGVIIGLQDSATARRQKELLS